MKWLRSVLLFLGLSFHSLVYALQTTPGSTDLSTADPLGGATFPQVVEKIANGLTVIAIPLVAVMFIFGGVQLMLSRGNPDGIKTGKQTLWYATLGLVAVLVATSVVAVIQSVLSP